MVLIYDPSANPLDWLVGFQRNVYRIGVIEQIGMGFRYNGNDGDVKG